MIRLLDLLRTSAKGDEALNALIDALHHVVYQDENAERRAHAAKYLGEIGGESVLPVLLHALEDDAPPVNLAALSAFTHNDYPNAAHPVAALLRSDDTSVRKQALAVLVQRGWSQAAQPADVHHLLDDTDPTVRAQAVRVLAASGTEADVPIIMEMLQDPDSRVGLAAAEALGELQDPGASKALFDVALDLTSYYRMREAALEAIVQIDAPHMNELLFDLLSQNTPDLDLYHTVVSSISRINTEAQVMLLLDAADWHSSLVRPARDALVRAGGEAVEAVMMRSLSHVREWIRALAVEVLGELRCERAVSAMLPLLHDEAQAVRLLAANALGQIGDTRAVTSLKRTLQDDMWLVQVAAASALARIDSEEARDASADWHTTRRDPFPPLDLNTDEDPPDVDLSDLT